jgi:hypothetical protein
MTTQEFVNQLQDLYGPFTTDGMMVAVMKRVSPLSDTQRDKLLETYVRTVPGTYKPDLKNVLDCMEKACIRAADKMKTCISCGHKWSSTHFECPACGYTKDDGDPAKYRLEVLEGAGKFNREVLAKLFKSWNKVPVVRG